MPSDAGLSAEDLRGLRADGRSTSAGLTIVTRGAVSLAIHDPHRGACAVIRLPDHWMGVVGSVEELEALFDASETA